MRARDMKKVSIDNDVSLRLSFQSHRLLFSLKINIRTFYLSGFFEGCQGQDCG